MVVRWALRGIFVAVMLVCSACGSGSASPASPESLAHAASSSAPGPSTPAPSPTPLAGVTLKMAVVNDEFAAVMQDLTPEFTAETGAAVDIDVLSYPELYSTITDDFRNHTSRYDLVTMDIVWTGEFAQNRYTADLTSRIDRDANSIGLDDFYDVDWSLGKWHDEQVAFPLAGYARLLNYNQPAFDAAGLPPPATMQELLADAKKLTDPAKNVYGITINGQRGSAGAQDFMTYNAQLGGALVDTSGQPELNSPQNVKNLEFFAELFTYAPPGALDFDWDAREDSFMQGTAMMQVGASIARPTYDDPALSQIAGKVHTTVVPVEEGLAPMSGFEGWGIAINADSSQQDAAWDYITWITGAEIQQRWAQMGAGAYIRKSTVRDPQLQAMYPWLAIVDDAFSHGDGDTRPRIPQYAQIESALGAAVNDVLHGSKTAQQALDDAQQDVAKAFG